MDTKDAIPSTRDNRPPRANVWEEAKEQHKLLSAAAAAEYDQLYEAANFATGSYMNYEVERIKKFMTEAPSKNLAVDLGCGTGRDSFILSRQFDQVYAYDFSPEMIAIANRKKLQERVGNVLFEVKDVEIEPIGVAENSVGFVNTGFGMGSFIRDPETLFKEVRRILQPRGIAIFSFYNVNALVNQLHLEWRPALAARVVENEDKLEVDFSGKKYVIGARAYAIKNLEQRVRSWFRPVELTTYPTLSALFPQKLFESEKARQLCTSVDEQLAGNTDIAAGPYIVCVCQKGGHGLHPEEKQGYGRVLELLKFHKIPLQIKEHLPVRTMEDVKAVLSVDPGLMAKTVLIAASEKEHPDPEDLDAAIFLFAIPANRKISMGKVAAVLGRSRASLRFATSYEVEKLTGFSVGSIPPFGHPRTVPIVLDEMLSKHKALWCGTGKSTESLKISLENLKRLSNFSVLDVSKPSEEK